MHRVWYIEMVTYNTCEWLVVQKPTRCGKPCKGRLCGVHLAQLRKTKREPRPCRICGKGTKAETQRCSRACGTDNIRHYLIRLEGISRRQFSLVMEELLLKAWRQKQRPLPFIY